MTEVSEKDLDKWYGHLTVENKEKAMGVPYPQCTEVWNGLSWSEKQYIYDAMGGREAHDHHKWKKGNGSLT